jgi:hypothetical protein
MDIAIKKAKEFGIGMVVARRSNHYGIAGIHLMHLFPFYSILFLFRLLLITSIRT